MNMVQDGMYANAPEKPLRMHGTPFQIQKARELVSGIIQQQQVSRGSGAELDEFLLPKIRESNQEIVEIKVPLFNH